MRLKLDENLGAAVAEALRGAGHDVATVASQGLCGAPDRTLLDVCRGEGRCIVTLDTEFANPLVFRPSSFAGIVVLRSPSRSSPASLVDLACTLARGLERADVFGKLWVVQRGRIREYQEGDLV